MVDLSQPRGWPALRGAPPGFRTQNLRIKSWLRDVRAMSSDAVELVFRKDVIRVVPPRNG